MPIDVLYPYPMVYKELGVIDKPKSLMQTVVNNYLRQGESTEESILPFQMAHSATVWRSI